MYFFFWGGGGEGGVEGARVSESRSKIKKKSLNPNLKYLFFLGGGGGGVRVSEFFFTKNPI